MLSCCSGISVAERSCCSQSKVTVAGTDRRRHANAAVLTGRLAARPARRPQCRAGPGALHSPEARRPCAAVSAAARWRCAAADSGSLVVSSVKRGRMLRQSDLRQSRAPASTNNLLCTSVSAANSTSCYLLFTERRRRCTEFCLLSSTGRI